MKGCKWYIQLYKCSINVHYIVSLQMQNCCSHLLAFVFVWMMSRCFCFSYCMHSVCVCVWWGVCAMQLHPMVVFVYVILLYANGYGYTLYVRSKMHIKCNACILFQPSRENGCDGVNFMNIKQAKKKIVQKNRLQHLLYYLYPCLYGFVFSAIRFCNQVNQKRKEATPSGGTVLDIWRLLAAALRTYHLLAYHKFAIFREFFAFIFAAGLQL